MNNRVIEEIAIDNAIAETMIAHVQQSFDEHKHPDIDESLRLSGPQERFNILAYAAHELINDASLVRHRAIGHLIGRLEFIHGQQGYNTQTLQDALVKIVNKGINERSER